ncbi:MAG: hypothetical protein IT384_16160 [Deltaproteobacteria bacterium]|nr:hypothetical protein [Deltaproteobacteria bacterium]
MDAWHELDLHLDGVSAELGGQGFMLFDSSLLQLSPRTKHLEAVTAVFNSAFEILESRFGADFVRRGAGRRFIQAASGPRFAAEPLLAAYVLLILLPEKNEGELAIARVLSRERWTIERLIKNLPPIGGGRRADVTRLPRP